jgi:hypothetical protein
MLPLAEPQIKQLFSAPDIDKAMLSRLNGKSQ